MVVGDVAAQSCRAVDQKLPLVKTCLQLFQDASKLTGFGIPQTISKCPIVVFAHTVVIPNWPYPLTGDPQAFSQLTSWLSAELCHSNKHVRPL